MEPLAFVMAILGCGEGDTNCAQLAVAPSRYESQAACLAATESEILRHGDAEYPVVVAQCRRADGRAQAVPASQVALPPPERNVRFASRSQR
jgi:hypothetical protein